MSAIKNVTLVGAAGNLGSFILEKLLASNKFNVQVIKRIGSASTFTEKTTVVEANFEDIESLKSVLAGQDAVVSAVGEAGVQSQKLLIDASIAVGVKRFLPSNFGCNMNNPNTRKLPVFQEKVVIEDYLVEKAKTTDLSYTFVYTGGFTDFGLRRKVIMDFSNYQPKIFNGGDSQFSCTSLPTVGDAVVGVLTHPAETQNRSVYVSESLISQNQLLALAKKIAPNKPWNPVDVDLNAEFAEALQSLADGKHDLPSIITILLKGILDQDYGPKYVDNDNALLGIEEKGEAFLTELLTPLLT